MALYAAGVQKRLIFKKEDTFGVVNDPSTGAEYFRRVESSLNLTKDTYESQEIRSDFQIADYRHGVRRVGGNLRAELSLNSFEGFLAAVLRKDFAAGGTYTATVSNELTFATDGDETTFDTITLDNGDDAVVDHSFRVGDVIRCTLSSESANHGVNMRIVGFADSGASGATNDVIQVMFGTSTQKITANASDSAAKIEVVGKKSYVPLTGHTSDSFCIEANHSDTDDSRVFSGCHIAGCNFSLPPTGLATLDFPIVGQDMTVVADGNAPYFTNVTAANTNSVLAAVNGSLRLAGQDVASLTGLELSIEVPWDAEPVVGSDVLPCFFPGRTRVSGQFTAYFGSESLLNDFINETERELHVVINAPGSTDFFSIFIPRIKIGGSPENDGEGGLIQTMPFMALLKQGATGYDETTIVIQDSTLT